MNSKYSSFLLKIGNEHNPVKMNFEELQLEIEKVNTKKWEYYRMYEQLEKEYYQLRCKLIQLCSDHDWRIDKSSYNEHTCWECTKCGAYR